MHQDPGRPRLDQALLRKKALTIFQERRDERKKRERQIGANNLKIDHL